MENMIEMKRLPRMIRKIINRLINAALLKHFKVDFGEELSINGVIEFGGHGKISIGDNVTINSGKEYNRIGGDTRTLIIALNNGHVEIGSNVGISNTALISHGAGIVIENNVFIGGGCKIYDTDHHSISYEDRMTAPDCNVKMAPVIIKKGAFIGAHSIILKGVTIGEKSVIGAGSVVTRDIPDNEVWAGNPINFIKKL